MQIIEDINKYRQHEHRKTASEILKTKWIYVKLGDYTNPILNMELIQHQQGQWPPLYPQRADYHELDIERHQIRAFQIMRTLLLNENLNINLEIPDNTYYQELVTAAKKVIDNTEISEEQINALFLWARYHDEGKYKETELHPATQINEERRVQGEKLQGSNKLTKFKNPNSDTNETDSEQLTIQFFRELKNAKFISVSTYNLLEELHKRYEVVYKNIKLDYIQTEHSEIIKEDRLAILLVIVDQLSKSVTRVTYEQELQIRNILNLYYHNNESK